MNIVYLAYMFGDFDSHNVIGIGTDATEAEKIIRASAKKDGYEVRDKGNGKFKKVSTISHERQSDIDDDYNYWIEDVRLNKPIC